MEKILIVEDDLQIQILLRDYLSAAGYNVILSPDGEDAIEKFKTESPDLALLDIMLPKVDGFELCRQFRKASNIPIIMLSSKKEDTDKILALGLGADDYIEKPFSPRVLIAKIQSQFRRINELSGTLKSDTLSIRELELNITEHTLTLNGTLLSLSVKEFEILEYLMKHPNQAVSRERLFDEVWGYNEFGDINTVTVHIRKLREKIEPDPSVPTYIETIWGIGYKLRN